KRVAAEPAGGAGRRVRARGPSGLDPAPRRRLLLRHAVGVEGIPGGSLLDGEPDVREPVELDGRRRATRRGGRELVHPWDRHGDRSRARRAGAGAARHSRGGGFGRLGAGAPSSATRGGTKAAIGGGPSDLRGSPL